MMHIWNRLAAEVEYYDHFTSTHHHNNHNTSRHPVRRPAFLDRPLDGGLLGATLVAWRTAVLHALSSSSQPHQPPISIPYLLHPWTMWHDCLERYHRSGLVDAIRPPAYAMILHVMGQWVTLQSPQSLSVVPHSQLTHAQRPQGSFTTTHNTNETPWTFLQAAISMHCTMVERSQHNPHDTLHHPTSATAYGLLQLCVACHERQAHVPLPSDSTPTTPLDPTQIAHEWVHALEHWYHQTRRLDQQPTANLYTSLLNLPPPSSFHNQLEWIQHCYQIMQHTCPDWNSGRTTAHVCHALANAVRVDREQEGTTTVSPRASSSSSLTTDHAPPPSSQTAADWAAQLVWDQCQRYQDHNYDVHFQPHAQAISSVLTAYGRQGRANEATEFWNAMQGWAQSLPSTTTTNHVDWLQHNWVCYSTLVWVYAQVGDTQRTEALLMQLLHAMEQGTMTNHTAHHNHNHKNNETQRQVSYDTAADSNVFGFDHQQQDQQQQDQLLLNGTLWEGVLTAWAKSGQPEAPAYMKQVLERLQTLRSRRQLPPVPVFMYNKVLSCHAHLGQPHQAEEWWDYMTRGRKQQQQEGEASSLSSQPSFSNAPTVPDPGMTPNGESYMAMILAWSKVGQPEKCEEYLKQYCQWLQSSPLAAQQQQQGRVLQKPFGIVLEAWANSQHPHAAFRAQAIVNVMQQDYQLQPNAVVYSSLLWAWVRSDPNVVGDVTQPVEHLWNQWKQQRQQQAFHYQHQQKQQPQSQPQGPRDTTPWKNHAAPVFQPTAQIVHAVLAALCKSTNPQAMERAHQVFEEMQQIFQIEPNVQHYTTLMNGYAKHQQPEKAEQVFRELRNRPSTHVQATTSSSSSANVDLSTAFRTRLEAWSQAGDPEMTLQVLKEWNQPSNASSSSWNGWTLHERPAIRDMSAVLRAWLRSNHPQAAPNAEATLRQMLPYFDPTTSSRSKTTTTAKNQTPKQGMDATSFDTVISAYAKSNTREAGARALGLLRELERLSALQAKQALTDDHKDHKTMPTSSSSSSSVLQPTLVSYTGVLVALCRSHKQGSPAQETEDDLDQVMTELQQYSHQQGQAFWSRVRTPERLLENVRRALEATPSLRNREKLLNQWRDLYATATATTRNKNNNNQ